MGVMIVVVVVGTITVVTKQGESGRGCNCVGVMMVVVVVGMIMVVMRM